MAALRLTADETHPKELLAAAGVPWFVSVFGRDSLIVSLQNMMVHPDFARGTLRRLADLQATEMDTYRDAEPGKMPHELRMGELAHFKRIPHTPYYGTADATILYIIAWHEAWKWLGDDGLLLATNRSSHSAYCGSINTEIATETDFRSTRHVRARATKTWDGKMPAMPLSIQTDRW